MKSVWGKEERRARIDSPRRPRNRIEDEDQDEEDEKEDEDEEDVYGSWERAMLMEPSKEPPVLARRDEVVWAAEMSMVRDTLPNLTGRAAG